MKTRSCLFTDKLHPWRVSLYHRVFDNKECTQRLLELSQLILDVDNRYASLLTPELYKERLLHQLEFDNISTKQTTQLLFKLRQKFYEHGEKVGKLLPHQLRQSAASSGIPEICVAADVTSTNPNEINHQFKQFDSALYSSDALPWHSLEMHAYETSGHTLTQFRWTNQHGCLNRWWWNYSGNPVHAEW